MGDLNSDWFDFFPDETQTGTLTQNIMSFNKCSIGGQAYGDIFDATNGEVIDPNEVLIRNIS